MWRTVLLETCLVLSILVSVHGQCDEALGLESGSVKDSQISASDNRYSRYKAYTARLNSGYGWLSRSGSYIQIDFLSAKRVTSLSVQGANIYNRYSKRLWVFYSIDGLVWDTYRDRAGSQDITVAATSGRQVVRIHLDSAIQARYIAISPRNSNPGLRLELYGCNSTQLAPTPTYINTDIDSNAIWTPSGNPYVIKSLITVRPSSQLTIQPGVKIIFETLNAGLLVRGSVVATGIYGLPVCFWSKDVPNQERNSWKGLVTESSGLFSCIFCSMRHAQVAVSGPINSLSLNATTLYHNFHAIQLTNGGDRDVTLNNLHIHDNKETGISVTEGWNTWGRVILRDSQIIHNDVGIELKAPCEIELMSCNISDSLSGGLRIDAKLTITVKNSVFIANNRYGISQGARSNLTIHSSIFENGQTGVSISDAKNIQIYRTVFRNNKNEGLNIGPRMGEKLEISLCKFDSNGDGVDIRLSRWEQGQITIANTTFVDNRLSSVYADCERTNVTLEYNIFNGTYESYPFMVSVNNHWGSSPVFVMVKNNVFRNYGSNGHIAAVTGDNTVTEDARALVLENVFENLNGTYALVVYAKTSRCESNIFRNSKHNVTLYVMGGDIVIHRNIFKNQNSSYEITTDKLYTENKSIDARYNYFGTSDHKEMRSRINDFFHNITKAEVLLDPFYTNEDLDVLDAGSDHFTYDEPLDAGGVLQGDVLIPRHQMLRIKRTIVVPPGITLTVERNVTMVFEKAQGIVVRGYLKLLGTPRDNIVFRDGGETRWGGILVRNSGIDMQSTVMKRAEKIGNLPSSNCSSYILFHTIGSDLDLGSFNLTAKTFNFNATDSKITSPEVRFGLSNCESPDDVERPGFILLKDSEFTNDVFEISVNSSFAERHKLTVDGCSIREADDNYILTDNGWRTADDRSQTSKGMTWRLDLKNHVHDEVALTKNTFIGGIVEIKADELLARNITVMGNVFAAAKLSLSTPDVNISRNIFENNPSHAVRFTKSGFDDRVISAEYNYWGTEMYLEIKAKVYDKANDPKLPKIEVVPFFQNRAMTEIVEYVSFIGENSTVGGNVEGRVTLTKSHSPYTVISTIYVGKESIFALGEGVKLLFTEGTGLVVEGTFLVSGSSELPVQFVAAVAGKSWEGVFLKGDEADVRFIGGKDEREGFVEVRRVDMYSTVCQDAFDSTDAQVICRMAGFDPEGGAIIYKGNNAKPMFGEGSNNGPVLYYDLDCLGNETHVDQCARKGGAREPSSEIPREPNLDPECPECEEEGSRRSGCYHFDDIALRCLGESVKETTMLPERRIEYLEINDTLSGITVGGNITHFSNVKSKFSKTTGIVVNMAFLSGHQHELHNIEASSNTKHGITAYGIDKYTTLTINGCVLSNNENHGISVSGYNTLSLRSCHIAGNDIGLYSSGYQYMNLSVSDSEVSSNRMHGVHIERSGYDQHDVYVSLVGNNISSHDTGYKYYSWQREKYYREIISLHLRGIDVGKLWVEGNTFFNNSGTVFVFEHSSIRTGFSTIVQNNTFTDNKGKCISIGGNNGKVHDVQITHNVISRNRIPVRGKESLISVHVTDEDSNLLILQNTMTENHASQLIRNDASGILESHAEIKNNTMVDNVVDEVLYLELYKVKIHWNIFVNPRAECELKMPKFVSGLDNNATLNYWGHSDVPGIMKRICGFDLDMNLGFVYYLPSYLSNTSNTVTTEKHTDFFIPGALGGVVEAELVLDDVLTPYHIDRSIMIREGGSLRLHGGNRLLFEQNRGIYTYGILETVTSNEEIKMTNKSAKAWFGLVFNQTSDLSLSYLNMSGAHHGVLVHTDNVEIKTSTLHNSETNGITLYSENAQLDLTDTVISNNKDHGLYIKSESIKLQNGVVRDNGESGVYFSDDADSATVEGMEIFGNKQYGLHFRHASRGSGPSMVNVSSCMFHGHPNRPGLYVAILSGNTVKETTVTHCIFENNRRGAFEINTLSRFGSYKSFVDIRSNNFYGEGNVEMEMAGWSNVTFAENHLNGTINKCFVAIEFDKSRTDYQMLNILSNTMRNATARCGFVLQSAIKPDGAFLYNEISASTFVDGALLLDLANYTFSQSILDNPLSDFEINVGRTGSGFINATNNWWGTTNLQQIQGRILDKHDEPRLVEVIYIPILEERNFDCSLVNNCSDHGDCVRPNGCECISGWKGTSCDEFDCSDLSDCNGGKCIGPNVCECNPGWIGESCTIAVCYGVNNCSERGFCVGPDTCKCLDQFRGASCEYCASNRWGPDCVACQRCVHGFCNQTTGDCICDGINWNGTLCDTCSTSFYGPECLPLATVLGVSPVIGPDVGGTLVQIKGDNFNISETKSYKCRFGKIVVNATRASYNLFTCVSPKLSPQTVYVEISSDGMEFTNNEVEFTFVSTCPIAACGSGNTPAHGQCLFGLCTCNLPWTGDMCSVEIMIPIVETLEESQLVEGQMYQQTLTLLQGTNVIRWSLLNGPEGMLIDQESGELTWARAVGSSTPYEITVRAGNPAGQNDMTWLLAIPLSYDVIIDAITPSGVLPYPTDIDITGYLNVSLDLNMTSPTVKILVENNGEIRELTATTDNGSPPRFSIKFVPQPQDSGTFRLSGNHPSDEEFEEQARWTVLSMELKPRVVSLTAYIDSGSVTFPGVGTISSGAGGHIEDVEVQVRGYPREVNSAEVTFSSSSNNESSTMLTSLNGSETFDLTVKHDLPIRTDLFIVFRSQLGTRSVFKVRLNLKVKVPTFEFTPTKIKRTVARGKQAIFNVNITNTGDAMAENVAVVVPDGLDLKIGSFSSSSMSASGNVSIPEGETATVVLIFTVPSDSPLGEVSGNIVVNSKDASSSLPFNLYVASDARFDIRIFIEDEYTYFAADKPYLSGAKITLKNPRRGTVATKTSDKSGIVSFTGVFGDQYTVEAEAANHTSTSLVIVVDGSKSDFSVFLQRTAVTYTWSVTKTSFEDKYAITLESTFETRVPLPVVTVEPGKVDLFPYEEGRTDKLEFLVTNHGYIRANNVQFSPPTHPDLDFIQLVDPIGDLEANTSIVVPFRVERKTIVKRSSGGGCPSMRLTYEYECGLRVLTGVVPIAVTNEPPGEPPKGCLGRPITFDGSASGGGQLSFRGFKSTLVPCDCTKALMNDCIKPLLRLPFDLVPGLGCLLNFYDASKINKDTSPVSAATTAAGIILDCGFGLSCPPCPYLFKLINCLDGLERGCKRDATTKREVNSELVIEMQRSRDFMNNYLNLTRELLGNISVIDVQGEWKTSFLEVTSENSPGEYLITHEEEEDLVQLVDGEGQQGVLGEFLERWNTTFSAWREGVTLADSSYSMDIPLFQALLDTFMENTKYAKDRGFTTIFNHMEYTVNEYIKALNEQKSEKGICAKVRIRISQDMVLTRDAFTARLELENGENAPLEDISVDIFITRTFGNGSRDNELFSIGVPTLTGMSGVSGTGILDSGVEGSAEWLIVAYNDAAVDEDVDYDIGGTLSYTVEGREINVPLLPDTISVSPNPSITVAYFHEKYVQGNDPFTEVMEESVPFSLAVMVTNKGNGVARQLRITSGQPEIIENEKGLLVSFEITSAQLGNDPIRPSLTVDFGDIVSQQTKTARWLMTSSLKGRFYNYSATFENINPLGDPQLSIFESVSYHDMIHLVRIDDEEADDLDDFLVNDVIDKDNHPDRLYDSSNGFYNYPVEVVSPSVFAEVNEETGSSKKYKRVRIVIPRNEGSWRYTRIVNNVTRHIEAESLLQVTRDDGKDVMIPQNAWQTSHYDNDFYFHLFDNDIRETEESVYIAMFGRSNMYQPAFANESYYIDIGSTASNTDLLDLQVTDLDGDGISFMLEEEGNETIFTVSEDGIVRNVKPLVDNGTFVLVIEASDDGVPSRSSRVTVTVQVIASATTEDRATTTPPPVATPAITGNKKPPPTSAGHRQSYIPTALVFSLTLVMLCGR